MSVFLCIVKGCRWSMFRRSFVYRLYFPETSRCRTGWTSVRLIRETLFSETLLIVSGWRRRMWKTISFCVSHLFSDFWRPFALGFTQDTKMGSFVFQCDVPHQWIAQRQVDPVSVYCDGVAFHALCLQHCIPVWWHIGQSTNAASRRRLDMNSMLNTNKQTNYLPPPLQKQKEEEKLKTMNWFFSPRSV